LALNLGKPWTPVRYPTFSGSKLRTPMLNEVVPEARFGRIDRSQLNCFGVVGPTRARARAKLDPLSPVLPQILADDQPDAPLALLGVGAAS